MDEDELLLILDELNKMRKLENLGKHNKSLQADLSDRGSATIAHHRDKWPATRPTELHEELRPITHRRDPETNCPARLTYQFDDFISNTSPRAASKQIFQQALVHTTELLHFDTIINLEIQFPYD
jgi:hypothetical protein